MKVPVLLTAVLVFVACDSKSDKTPEQIEAEVAASQQRFAGERQRIEGENRAREARVAEQRSFVTATFAAVKEQRIEVELANSTDKPIDNLSGSLEIEDEDGNYVTGIALTNWVPGDIYLPVGAKARAQKGLELETPEQRNKILAEANRYRYHFTTHRIQYAGEDEINFLESADTSIQAPGPAATAETSEPVDRDLASPELCAADQLSIETEEYYYPGPLCEHVQRNIDSERFKQEYIRLCQAQTRADSPPASAARVQLSSCEKAPDVKGIVYTKRICCDVS
jgi:hypothetical protein